MLIVAILLFLFKGGSGMLLAHVAVNILHGVRKDLYTALMRKDIGWHDLRENSTGIITSTLASDVQLLNGVASDGLQVQVESMSAVLCAIITGFIFSWPMTCVGLVIIPFIMICGAIVAKADNENFFGVEELETEDDKSDDVKNTQILAADSI